MICVPLGVKSRRILLHGVFRIIDSYLAFVSKVPQLVLRVDRNCVLFGCRDHRNFDVDVASKFDNSRLI